MLSTLFTEARLSDLSMEPGSREVEESEEHVLDTSVLAGRSISETLTRGLT